MKHSRFERELVLLSRYFLSGSTFGRKRLSVPYLDRWVRLSGRAGASEGSRGHEDIAQMRPPDTAQHRKPLS